DIASIWGNPRDVVVLSGRAATKAALTSAIAGHRVVHLATHGFFLRPECEAALPTTRGVGGLISGRAPAAVDNPLLLSGLALAGVNALSGARQSDGILNAEEIAGLNLQGTEWAVLSACDTGLGQITAGGGVVGLRPALQICGVHTRNSRTDRGNTGGLTKHHHETDENSSTRHKKRHPADNAHRPGRGESPREVKRHERLRDRFEDGALAGRGARRRPRRRG